MLYRALVCCFIWKLHSPLIGQISNPLNLCCENSLLVCCFCEMNYGYGRTSESGILINLNVLWCFQFLSTTLSKYRRNVSHHPLKCLYIYIFFLLIRFSISTRVQTVNFRCRSLTLKVLRKKTTEVSQTIMLFNKTTWISDNLRSDKLWCVILNL